jgi:hypothetical protein
VDEELMQGMKREVNAQKEVAAQRKRAAQLTKVFAGVPIG